MARKRELASFWGTILGTGDVWDHVLFITRACHPSIYFMCEGFDFFNRSPKGPKRIAKILVMTLGTTFKKIPTRVVKNMLKADLLVAKKIIPLRSDWFTKALLVSGFVPKQVSIWWNFTSWNDVSHLLRSFYSPMLRCEVKMFHLPRKMKEYPLKRDHLQKKKSIFQASIFMGDMLLVGRFNPIEKTNARQNWVISSSFGGKNKKSLKPPRWIFRGKLSWHVNVPWENFRGPSPKDGKTHCSFWPTPHSMTFNKSGWISWGKTRWFGDGWWFRNPMPNHRLDEQKTLLNNGDKLPFPQLVNAGFLNHQQDG